MLWDHFQTFLNVDWILTLEHFFKFSPLHDVVFGAFIVIFDFIIAFRANQIYSKDFDKRMALISAGFLFGGIFQSIHFMIAYIYQYNTDTKIMQAYVFFEILSYAIALYLAIFYFVNPISERPQQFRRKVYFSFFAFFLFVVLSSIFEMHILERVTFTYIFGGLYLLLAAIYADLRFANNLKPMCMIILGFIFVGLNQTYLEIGTYFTSYFRFFGHTMILLSKPLILFGLNDIRFTSKMFGIRQKLLCYPPLLFIVSFLSLSLITSIIFKFETYPIYFQYYFIIFFVVLSVFQYILAFNLSNPVLNMIKGIEENKPGEKPKKIPIVSQDEVGILANKFNNNAELMWNYTQQIEAKTKREILLRDVISAIRSTLDIAQIKHSIVLSVGSALNADKVFIIDYDKKTNKYLPVKDEYLSKLEFISSIGFDAEKSAPNFVKITKSKNEILFSDREKFLQENDLLEKPEAVYLRNYQSKSVYAVPICHSEQLQGVLVIHYIAEQKEFDNEELLFVRTIADQIGIAFYQAQLFESVKDRAEREHVLRKITETIKIATDVDQVLKVVAAEVAGIFNVQRVSIVQYPGKTAKCEWKIRYIYRIDESIPTITSFKIDHQIPEFYHQRVVEEDVPMVYADVQTSDAPDFFKEFYKNLGVKSILSVPIKKGDDKWGFIVLFDYNMNRNWTDDEVILLKIIADQLFVAIKQVELYEAISKTAQKESLLREIVSEIKLSLDLNEVYNYIISKLASIFNVPRVFFIETYAFKYEKPRVKYEISKDEFNLLSTRDPIPVLLNEFFSEIANSGEPQVIENCNEFNSGNAQLQAFFKKYNIATLYGIPLIRYNHDSKILGIMVLCNNSLREWNDYEINLVKAITESVVTVVWETSKLIEINKLRDTFISTLAHDLHVPIIGEKKAIEVLLSRPGEQTIGKYRALIEGMLYNNIQLSEQLNRLLCSYYYEAGKKQLVLNKQSIYEIVNHVIDLLKEKANKKRISITSYILEQIPLVLMDKDEIVNVVFNLLDNSINYTQEGGYVEIHASIEQDCLKVCISDNGPGISPKIRNRIFERYETAMAIERKVGSGLGLYLCKQIIKAHNGEISYTTELGVGTTFCFTIPIM